MLRRFLAAFALGLALVHGASVAAAVVVCARGAMAEPTDCCAKGAHPAGFCPFRNTHRSSSASAATCRLSGAASDAGPIVLIPAAMPPPAVTVSTPGPTAPTFTPFTLSIIETFSPSDTPPPRS